MKQTRIIKITFITPCFCRGANDNVPEIRAASIRGQLHWWFRALGGSREDENEIFGSVHAQPNELERQKSNESFIARSSKVIIRVRTPRTNATDDFATLPHHTKPGESPANKKAFIPTSSFELLVSLRDYPGSNDSNTLQRNLNEGQKAAFWKCVDAWLLVGALGYRATRGGGNFKYDNQPETPEAYRLQLNKTFSGTPFHVALSEKLYNPVNTMSSNHYPEASKVVRKDITDMLGSEGLADLNYPLGGLRPSRKTSPLRFRIVEFEKNGKFGVVVGWDGREDVTGNTLKHLKTAVERLRSSDKRIADVLKSIPFLK